MKNNALVRLKLFGNLILVADLGRSANLSLDRELSNLELYDLVNEVMERLVKVQHRGFVLPTDVEMLNIELINKVISFFEASEEKDLIYTEEKIVKAFKRLKTKRGYVFGEDSDFIERYKWSFN